MAQRRNALLILCDLLQNAGDMEGAMQAAQQAAGEKSDKPSKLDALAMGRIADILQARGEWDEALRIRREEQMPVYEWLGNVYSLIHAVCNFQ